jgi:hypothetical protein
MSYVNAIVTNAVENTIAKNKQNISKVEISRRKLAFIKIALESEHDTKKAIADALRQSQLSGTPANIESVQNIRFAIRNLRNNKILYRVRARNNKIIDLPAATGRAPVTLRPGNLVDRLHETRRLTLKSWAFHVIRHGAPGGTSFTIKFASTTSEVDYRINLGSCNNVFRGQFKGWSANIDNHVVVIPRDWRVRVQRQGLANLGGMFTLDAHRLESPQGMEIFAAVWVTQSRGYSVKVERGYIVIAGGEHCHGETVEAAIKGLKAKCKAAMYLTDLDSSANTFADKYASVLINVSLDDARKTGSCEYGIRSWCASVGIDVERIEVPMGELLEGFRRRPMPEVRRAVIKAVKRNRVKLVS